MYCVSNGTCFASVRNRKICGKILPKIQQQGIMQKHSTEFGNKVCYAESFRLITSYGILGGNIQSINS